MFEVSGYAAEGSVWPKGTSRCLCQVDFRNLPATIVMALAQNETGREVEIQGIGTSDHLSEEVKSATIRHIS
jgi:hypothetical protein